MRCRRHVSGTELKTVLLSKEIELHTAMGTLLGKGACGKTHWCSNNLADEFLGEQSLEGMASHQFSGHAKRVLGLWSFNQDTWCATIGRPKGRATARLQKLGPAAVLFVEPWASGVYTVILIVLGGTLLGAAPEYQRLAS